MFSRVEYFDTLLLLCISILKYFEICGDLHPGTFFSAWSYPTAAHSSIEGVGLYSVAHDLAASSPGVAAADGEMEKMQRYGPAVIPVAIESYGRMG